MAFNLPEAVKAAHSLSKAGQEKLKAAIASQYGVMALPVKEAAPVDPAAAEKALAAVETAKRLEAERLAREDADIRAILAAIGSPEIFEENRAGALRAIAEVIGVAEVKKTKGGEA